MLGNLSAKKRGMLILFSFRWHNPYKSCYTSPQKEHVYSLHLNRSNVFPQIGNANENLEQ